MSGFGDGDGGSGPVASTDAVLSTGSAVGELKLSSAILGAAVAMSFSLALL